MLRRFAGIMSSEWNSFPLSPNELQLDNVLPAGQSFRWRPDLLNSGHWIGVFGHHAWTLRQSESTLFYKIHTPSPPPMKEMESLLRAYFQLDVSLTALYEEWRRSDPRFETLTSAGQFRGIRILAQDPTETLFAFICSTNNNIKRITSLVEKLCSRWGNLLAEVQGVALHDFPALDKLGGDDVEAELRKAGFGYRAPFIVNSANRVLENGGEQWLRSLTKGQGQGYQYARTQLMGLPGIGPKVADCICLMGLGYNEAIPLDTHMHALGRQYLPHLPKVKTLTPRVYMEISGHFQGLHGKYAGWAQSVLFSSTLPQLQLQHSAPSPAKKQRKKIQQT